MAPTTPILLALAVLSLIAGTARAQAPLKFVVISDTHLGRRGDAERLERLIPVLKRERPNVILHAGDLFSDSIGDDVAMAQAKRLLSQLPAPLVIVPGNHDVGLCGRLKRLQRWRAAIGPTERVLEVRGWRVVGFDAQALTAACRDNARREAVLTFLEKELTAENGPRTLLLQHLPEIVVPYREQLQAPWEEKALRRFQSLLDRARPAGRFAGHWHVSVLVPGAPGLAVAPAVSSLGNVPTGYLRGAATPGGLKVERVMVETAGKRELPLVVRLMAIPEGAPLP